MKKMATILITMMLISPVFAQDWLGMGGASKGVTSVGTGHATANITMAEITGLVKSEAELAGDAMVKFKGAKRRALDAVKNLEISGLAVKESGVTVSQGGGNQQMMMRQMMGQAGAASPKPQVQVEEEITLVLSGIDKMDDVTRVNTLARILDAGTDAGLEFGAGGNKSIMEMQMEMNKSPSIISFVSPDADAVTEKATKLAVAEARANAEKMAELSNITLGKVTSISTQTGAGQDMYNPYTMWQMMLGMQQKDEKGENRLVSTVFQPISVEVNVIMTFAIE